MSHECDDCGQEFETLTRLRLHDCPPEKPPSPSSDATEDTDNQVTEPSSDYRIERAELERRHPELVGKLPDLFDDACAGDIAALPQAIAEYERVLDKVSRGEAPGGVELHSDILFAYYEPFADGLDEVAQAHDWNMLLDFVDAYNYHEQDEFPEVAHLIANVLGRSIIRTRQLEGVDAIPAEALAYLGGIPECVRDSNPAYEQSYTYGWGIGHSDHSVADRLYDLAENEHKFVKITLNTAFYVDQHQAIDVLERLVTADDIDTTTDSFGRTVDLTEFYFKLVADLKTDKLVGPHAPIYWPEGDNLERVLSIDPNIEQRIRQLAEKTGVTFALPDNWDLHHLDQSIMAGILDDMNE